LRGGDPLEAEAMAQNLGELLVFAHMWLKSWSAA
jgi:hypothetical protein